MNSADSAAQTRNPVADSNADTRDDAPPRTDSGGYRVCRVRDLPVGERRIVSINQVTVGVFHLPDGFYALANRCPHRGAPLCQGVVTGLITAERAFEFNLSRDGEVVRCPWHGWEFDITTGRSLFNPHKIRTRSYPVTTERTPLPPEACTEGIDAEGVPSYQTTIEDEWVVVHLKRPASANQRPVAGRTGSNDDQ